MDGAVGGSQADAAKAKEQEELEKEFASAVLEEQASERASERATLQSVEAVSDENEEEEVTRPDSIDVFDITKEQQELIIAAAGAAYDASDSTTHHSPPTLAPTPTPTKAQAPSSSNPNTMLFHIVSTCVTMKT